MAVIVEDAGHNEGVARSNHADGGVNVENNGGGVVRVVYDSKAGDGGGDGGGGGKKAEKGGGGGGGGEGVGGEETRLTSGIMALFSSNSSASKGTSGEAVGGGLANSGPGEKRSYIFASSKKVLGAGVAGKDEQAGKAAATAPSGVAMNTGRRVEVGTSPPTAAQPVAAGDNEAAGGQNTGKKKPRPPPSDSPVVAPSVFGTRGNVEDRQRDSSISRGRGSSSNTVDFGPRVERGRSVSSMLSHEGESTDGRGGGGWGGRGTASDARGSGRVSGGGGSGPIGGGHGSDNVDHDEGHSPSELGTLSDHEEDASSDSGESSGSSSRSSRSSSSSSSSSSSLSSGSSSGSEHPSLGFKVEADRQACTRVSGNTINRADQSLVFGERQSTRAWRKCSRT